MTTVAATYCYQLLPMLLPRKSLAAQGLFGIW